MNGDVLFFEFCFPRYFFLTLMCCVCLVMSVDTFSMIIVVVSQTRCSHTFCAKGTCRLNSLMSCGISKCFAYARFLGSFFLDNFRRSVSSDLWCFASNTAQTSLCEFILSSFCGIQCPSSVFLRLHHIGRLLFYELRYSLVTQRSPVWFDSEFRSNISMCRIRARDYFSRA